MANSTNMALALAAIFDLSLMTVEGISRALNQAGLRTDGGKGRGASRMTGRDTFNITLALAGSVGMKAAPPFVQNIIDMELKNGVLLQDEQIVWTPSDQPSKGSVLALMKQDLLPGVQASSTLGDLMAKWIDGIYDADLPWRDQGEAVLKIGLRGQWAEFALDWAGNRLELDFATPGADTNTTPAWENLIILRGDLFRMLVKIVEE